MFQGQRPLRHQLLLEIAPALELASKNLVAETASESLLHTAPETPALEESVRLREDLDRHCARLAVTEAALAQVSAQASERRDYAVRQEAHAAQLARASEHLQARQSGGGEAIAGGLLGFALALGPASASSHTRR